MSLVYLYLTVSIVAEVIATTMLKASDGFYASIAGGAAAVIGYGFAFYFMSLTLRSVPTGVVYAIWSGRGLCLFPLSASSFTSRYLIYRRSSGSFSSLSAFLSSTCALKAWRIDGQVHDASVSGVSVDAAARGMSTLLTP